MTCEEDHLDEMTQEGLEQAMFNHMGYRWPNVFPEGTTWGNDFSRNLVLGGEYLKRFGTAEWLKLDEKFDAIYKGRLGERINALTVKMSESAGDYWPLFNTRQELRGVYIEKGGDLSVLEVAEVNFEIPPDWNRKLNI